MTKIRNSPVYCREQGLDFHKFLCFPKKRENVAATNQMYRISLEMMLTSEVSYCDYCA